MEGRAAVICQGPAHTVLTRKIIQMMKYSHGLIELLKWKELWVNPNPSFIETRRAEQRATCLRQKQGDGLLPPLAQSCFHDPTHKAAVPRALSMKRFSLQVFENRAKRLSLRMRGSFHHHPTLQRFRIQ